MVLTTFIRRCQRCLELYKTKHRYSKICTKCYHPRRRYTTWKKMKCADCGETENIHQHHTSYKNNITIPVCIQCHSNRHGKIILCVNPQNPEDWCCEEERAEEIEQEEMWRKDNDAWGKNERKRNIEKR